MKKTVTMISRLLVSALTLGAVPLAAGAAPTVAKVTQAEQQSWMSARAADSAEAYTKFITEFPESPLVAEAYCRLDSSGGGDGCGITVTQVIDPAIVPGFVTNANNDSLVTI